MAPPKAKATVQMVLPLPTKALIIADTFSSPLSVLPLPSVLAPVCDVPMLEYMIDHLTANNIDTIYLATTNPALISYLSSSVWATRATPHRVQIHVLSMPSCTSSCDILRSFYARRVFTEPFLLVDGPVVSNAPLAPLFEGHQRRRSARQGTICTAHYGHGEDFAVVDAAQTRLFTTGNPSTTSTPTIGFSIDQLKLAGPAGLSLVKEVGFAGYMVCETGLLEWANDSFDVHTLPALISSILSDGALHGHECGFYSPHSLTFTLPVNNWRTYSSVTTSVIRRHIFPYMPESNVLCQLLPTGPAPTTFTRRTGNITVGEGACIGSSAKLMKGGTLVGNGAQIGDNTVVNCGVVGTGAKVGAGCQLRNSILWAGVSVGDNCTLNDCVVTSATFSLIGQHFDEIITQIGDNCVLTNCIIYPGAKVAANTVATNQCFTGYDKLTACTNSDDFSGDWLVCEGAPRPEGGARASTRAPTRQNSDFSDDEVTLSSDIDLDLDEDDDLINALPAAARAELLRIKEAEAAAAAAAAAAVAAAEEAEEADSPALAPAPITLPLLPSTPAPACPGLTPDAWLGCITGPTTPAKIPIVDFSFGEAEGTSDAESMLVDRLSQVISRCTIKGQTTIPTMLTEVRTTSAAFNCDIVLGIAVLRAALRAAAGAGKPEQTPANFVRTFEFKHDNESFMREFNELRQHFYAEEKARGQPEAQIEESWELDVLYGVQDELINCELYKSSVATQNIVFVVVEKLKLVSAHALHEWFAELTQSDVELEKKIGTTILPVYKTLCDEFDSDSEGDSYDDGSYEDKSYDDRSYDKSEYDESADSYYGYDD